MSKQVERQQARADAWKGYLLSDRRDMHRALGLVVPDEEYLGEERAIRAQVEAVGRLRGEVEQMRGKVANLEEATRLDWKQNTELRAEVKRLTLDLVDEGPVWQAIREAVRDYTVLDEKDRAEVASLACYRLREAAADPDPRSAGKEGGEVPPGPLTIALDYDGTYAADPGLWIGFLGLLKARGHSAVLVTGRSNGTPWASDVRAAIGDRLPIVFAGAQWKRHAAEAAGYEVDIWIDDHPEFIGEQDAELLAGKRAAMGEPPTTTDRDRLRWAIEEHIDQNAEVELMGEHHMVTNSHFLADGIVDLIEDSASPRAAAGPLPDPGAEAAWAEFAAIRHASDCGVEKSKRAGGGAAGPCDKNCGPDPRSAGPGGGDNGPADFLEGEGEIEDYDPDPRSGGAQGGEVLHAPSHLDMVEKQRLREMYNQGEDRDSTEGGVP